MRYVLLGGVLVLCVGVVAFVKNYQATKATSAPPTPWLRFYRWRWVALLMLAAAAYFATWSTTGSAGDRIRIVGFPFPAAAFDSSGADYVGALTLPLMLLNMATWALLPDICLYVWRRAVLRRNLTVRA
jgi:hypothetical protein